VPWDNDTLWLFLLLPTGFVAGVINVLAGGGSFLTLPVLIAAGLPLPIANGTNRISVVVQGIFATASYHQKGEFDAALYKRLLPPLLLGALLGAFLATKIDPRHLRTVFGVLFLLMATVLLVRAKQESAPSTKQHPLRYPALFFVGMYGGFIQAGVGLWILLASTGLFAADTLKANSVKLPLTLTFTAPALLIFLQADAVRWIPGLVLALGTVLGTSVGVRLSIQGGAPLILRAVTVVLILTGVRLLFP
jgi:uncharacterized membrane protein YfcA